jgi:hypothetical protein
MKNSFRLSLLGALLVASCTSGKKAYQHGDYYDAVLEAVDHLRHSPENKKSKEVLTLSYQAAVDFLNTDATNQIASNANFKWKAVVQDYNKINNLYENIRTCPGALRVIPVPVDKYKELPVAKDSAAQECYNAAVQAMMKNTRQDAKQAYFLLSDVITFSPGYRESVEMLQQAKLNATLNVVVDPSYQNNHNWTFDQVIFGSTGNQFVKFFTPQQVQDEKLQRVDQHLRVVVNGFQESRPILSKTNQAYQDSVASGSRTVNGQSRTTYQRVYSDMAIYQKQITASGSLQLMIQDGSNQAELANSTLTSQVNWTDQWAICSGDSRAIPRTIVNLCGRNESFPAAGLIINQTKRELDLKLANALNGFYRNY